MTLPFPPRRILVPLDAGEASRRALGYARMMKEQFGSSVVALHAHYFELPPYFSSGQVDLMRKELRGALRSAHSFFRERALAELGSEPETVVVEKAPVDAILDAAQEEAVDLIAMGTHGRRGAERAWLGSVAERILRESPKPVLVTRESARASGIRRLLCPVDTGPVAQLAMAYASRLSEAFDAALLVLHVDEKHAEARPGAPVDDDVRRRRRVEEVARHGTPAAVILEEVDKYGPDLVIMGAERKRGALGLLFSSTTEIVMQRAAAPLIVVPLTRD